jgi:shikimate kinase
VIEELVSLKNIILSTGGGSVLSPVNRKALEDNGTIIYLKSTAEKLFKRTAEDKRRPLLQTEDRLGQIKKILSEREPYYLSMADEIIDTHDLGIKQIINKILKLIETNESN